MIITVIEYPSDYPTSKSYTVDEILYPEASGALVLDSDVTKVDYSNTNQGYVMAFLKPGVSKRIKIQISKDEQKTQLFNGWTRSELFTPVGKWKIFD
ncbi:MAG: hypothetical protein V8R63_11760 [Thomasclavelia ramosa]